MSRDREGAVESHCHAPLPHGRGSRRAERVNKVACLSRLSSLNTFFNGLLDLTRPRMGSLTAWASPRA